MPLHCPICQAEILDSAETSLRPFCSQRCKLADLHNWLTGVYRVSTPLDPNELGEDEFKLRS